MKKIVKRDGRVVAFNENKITTAIKKAAEDAKYPIDKESLEKLTDKVVNHLEENFDFKDKKPMVEDIQDIVERTLTENNLYEVVKSYILYREERSQARDRTSDLMKTVEGIALIDSKDMDLKRENGNINGDTCMGKFSKVASEASKKFAHLKLLSKEASKAHLNGDIHIHDLDFYSTGTLTCCQIDLDKLFEHGFNTGEGFIRPPQSIKTAAALCCIALQANQNEQHGGQAIPAFDLYLSRYVARTFIDKFIEISYNRYDIDEETQKNWKTQMRNFSDAHDKTIIHEEGKNFVKELTKDSVKEFEKVWDRAYEATDKDTFQAMESLVHNLNSMHSRNGNQVPFTSLNYGTCTTTCGRMVIKNILLATEKGLGNGETPIFPISIFKVKEGVNYNPGDPNYDLFKLAIRVSATRLFPNFVYVDSPFNLQYYDGTIESEIATMGCRTRVIANTYDPAYEKVARRGNLSFTTINLPRLGIKAKGDINKFYKMLDEMMELVKNQLLDRLKFQGSMKVRNFPFLMGQDIWKDSEKLTDPDDTLEEVIKQGSLSIGFIGLAETLVALTGKHHGESEESQKLGLEIVKHMREYCDEQSKKYNLNFGLIGTPAEGIAGRFTAIDRKRYGKIPGITDRMYYTNSSHVPVYYPTSCQHKLEVECPYHALENAGHIAYVEISGNPANNLEAFEKVVRLAHDLKCGYFALNFQSDTCTCGYHGIINDECPQCGHKEGDIVTIDELKEKGINTTFLRPDDKGMVKISQTRLRRVTGYLVGDVRRFNNYKRAEEHDRVKHDIMKYNGFIATDEDNPVV